MAFDTHGTNVYERVQRTFNTIQFGSSLLGCMPVWYEILCIIRLLYAADYLKIDHDHILDPCVLDLPIKCQWYVTLFRTYLNFGIIDQ